MKFQHSSAYIEDQASRRLCRILYGGTPEAQAASAALEIMWPKPGENRDYYLPNESPSPETNVNPGTSSGGKVSIYEDRVRNSVLPPVWWDSVRKAAMAPLRETVTPVDFAPEVEAWIADVDGAGRSLRQFLTEILENQGVDGIAFALADLETVADADGNPVPRSAGDDDRAGIRPYAVSLEAADVDPIAVGKVSGKTMLLECAVYQESTAREAGATTAESKTALWRIFKLADGGVITQDLILEEADREADIVSVTEWRKIEPIGSGSLTRIPVTPFYADFGSGAYRGKPPYRRPAELAIAAYRKRSEKDQLGRENARLRFFQNHIPRDEQGNAKIKMLANFLYSEADGDAKVLETSGAALKELREDLREDENAVRTACRSIAAEGTSGDVTATEIGLRGVESGTYSEVVTRGNAMSVRSLLQDLESLGGATKPSGGTVSWPYRATQALAEGTLQRLKELVETPGAEGRPLLPLATFLYLERLAGNLPEGLDIAAAAAGTLEDQ